MLSKSLLILFFVNIVLSGRLIPDAPELRRELRTRHQREHSEEPCQHENMSDAEGLEIVMQAFKTTSTDAASHCVMSKLVADWPHLEGVRRTLRGDSNQPNHGNHGEHDHTGQGNGRNGGERTNHGNHGEHGNGREHDPNGQGNGHNGSGRGGRGERNGRRGLDRQESGRTGSGRQEGGDQTDHQRGDHADHQGDHTTGSTDRPANREHDGTREDGDRTHGEGHGRGSGRGGRGNGRRSGRRNLNRQDADRQSGDGQSTGDHQRGDHTGSNNNPDAHGNGERGSGSEHHQGDHSGRDQTERDGRGDGSEHEDRTDGEHRPEAGRHGRGGDRRSLRRGEHNDGDSNEHEHDHDENHNHEHEHRRDHTAVKFTIVDGVIEDHLLHKTGRRKYKCFTKPAVSLNLVSEPVKTDGEHGPYYTIQFKQSNQNNVEIDMSIDCRVAWDDIDGICSPAKLVCRDGSYKNLEAETESKFKMICSATPKEWSEQISCPDSA